MWYMGVDMGTSGCKAVVFDHAFAIHYSAYQEYDLAFSGGGNLELDPLLVWRHIKAAIKEANSNSPQPVEALAVSAIGDVIIPLGGNGEAVRPSIIDFDPRGEDEITAFAEAFDKKAFFEITGMPPLFIGSLAKILWLQKHEPENCAKVARFATYEDYLVEKLGLPPAVSYSEAARTMLFDIRKKDWSNEILTAARVDRRQLARPVLSGTPLGYLPDTIARELGFIKPVLVGAGGHDIVCAAMGAGLDENKTERAVNVSGTTDCIIAALREPNTSEEMLINNFPCYPAYKGYITFSVQLTAGNVVKWYRNILAKDEYALCTQNGINFFEYMRRQLNPEACGNLVFIPHFSGSGNPSFNPADKGALYGLTLDTTREDILHALLEGLCFECRLHTEALRKAGIPIQSFIAVGGGNENNKQLQLKANILGRDIIKTTGTEASALGAALFAALAAGEISDPTEPFAGQKAVGETIHCNIEAAETFMKGYERYCRYRQLR